MCTLYVTVKYVPEMGFYFSVSFYDENCKHSALRLFFVRFFSPFEFCVVIWRSPLGDTMWHSTLHIDFHWIDIDMVGALYCWKDKTIANYFPNAEIILHILTSACHETEQSNERKLFVSRCKYVYCDSYKFRYFSTFIRGLSELSFCLSLLLSFSKWIRNKVENNDFGQRNRKTEEQEKWCCIIDKVKRGNEEKLMR